MPRLSAASGSDPAGVPLLSAISGLQRGSTLASPDGQLLPTGLAALDRALGGGLPTGRLTEVQAPGGGHGSLLVSLAARATSRGGTIAWIDPGGFLDIRAAQRAGAVLERILWVRPQNVAQAVRAVDLILGADGFELAILDLASLPAGAWRAQLREPGFRLDGAAWNRLVRRAQLQDIALVVASDRDLVPGVSALTLQVQLAAPIWREGEFEGAYLEVSVLRRRGASGGFSGRFWLSLVNPPDPPDLRDHPGPPDSPGLFETGGRGDSAAGGIGERRVIG